MRLKLWLVVIIVLVVAFAASAVTTRVVKQKYHQLGKDKVQLYVQPFGAESITYIKIEDYRKTKA